MIRQLTELPDKVKETLSDVSSIEKIAKKIYKKDHCILWEEEIIFQLL